jgi:4-aminobutyrate aminotransferase-like enzyme
MTAPTVDDIAHILAGLKLRLAAKGKDIAGGYPLAMLTLTHEAVSICLCGVKHHNFRAPTFAAALALAEEWLDRDELAEGYATLGLSADGRYLDAAE